MSEPKAIYTIVKENKIHVGDSEYEIPNYGDTLTISQVKSKTEIDYWNQVFSDKKQAIEDATLEFTMHEIKDFIRARGSKVLESEFVIDAENETAIEQLILYFCNSKEFEKANEGFSLKKGIMLMSDSPGTGKTILMKIFSRSRDWKDDVMFPSYEPFKVISCKKIVSAFRREGDAVMERFTENNTGKPTLETWVFDDLGREDTQAVHFGNRTNVFERILAERYDLFIDNKIKTHITTNIVDGNDFENLYGNYIRSRMREMFNVIILKGKDRRK